MKTPLNWKPLEAKPKKKYYEVVSITDNDIEFCNVLEFDSDLTALECFNQARDKTDYYGHKAQRIVRFKNIT